MFGWLKTGDGVDTVGWLEVLRGVETVNRGDAVEGRFRWTDGLRGKLADWIGHGSTAGLSTAGLVQVGWPMFCSGAATVAGVWLPPGWGKGAAAALEEDGARCGETASWGRRIAHGTERKWAILESNQ